MQKWRGRGIGSVGYIGMRSKTSEKSVHQTRCTIDSIFAVNRFQSGLTKRRAVMVRLAEENGGSGRNKCEQHTARDWEERADGRKEGSSAEGFIIRCTPTPVRACVCVCIHDYTPHCLSADRDGKRVSTESSRPQRAFRCLNERIDQERYRAYLNDKTWMKDDKIESKGSESGGTCRPNRHQIETGVHPRFVSRFVTSITKTRNTDQRRRWQKRKKKKKSSFIITLRFPSV